MKSPLWILNSTFVLLFLVSLLLVFFIRVQLPVRTALLPQVSGISHENEGAKVNPVLIYENDLFGTVVKPTEPKKEEVPQLKEIVIPEPPKAVSATSRPQIPPEFLPPLQLKLRGIIFNTNSLYSRAILINTKSNAESLCKIGDKLEDAILIHIGKKKAVLVRPNGQQETLFITEGDASKDPLYQGERTWAKAITPLNDKTFRIDVTRFKKQITNVAQLIDQLDITPAIESGKNIGCRIGQFGKQSIGQHLGLKYGDIITAINGKKPSSTKNRVAIFKEIREAGKDQKIIVALSRDNAPLELTYVVQPVSSEEDEEMSPAEGAQTHERHFPAGMVVEQSGPSKAGSFGAAPGPQRPAAMPSPAAPLPPPPGAPGTPAGLTRQANTPSALGQPRVLASNEGQKPIEEAFARRDKKSMLGYGSRSAFLQR
ncbi:MAG: hypothetical protein M1549_01315 [Candidatus Dependentiae bacterium]|nr:hypothetical protein [Candidatus Dependentiae bacterium]